MAMLDENMAIRIRDWWTANNDCCDSPPCSLWHRPSLVGESCLSQGALAS